MLDRVSPRGHDKGSLDGPKLAQATNGEDLLGGFDDLDCFATTAISPTSCIEVSDRPQSDCGPSIIEALLLTGFLYYGAHIYQLYPVMFL